MPDFYLTRVARADLKAIGRYTETRWGCVQRNKYLAMLDGCFQDLASDPLKGRDCSHLREGYRKYSTGSHIIFYRLVDPQAIEIVRILHARMDVGRHLPDNF